MNPLAFYIENHSASELKSAELATLTSLSTRPEFPNKQAFAAWCHDSRTRHVFYTLAEPEYSTMRSSGQNPIKYLHGLVADYDGMAAAIRERLPTLRFKPGLAPTWVTTTFSGKARLIWAFESRVPIFGAEVQDKVMDILAKELDVESHLPGLDKGAWKNPHTPYELGTEWRQPFGDVRLASSFVLGAVYDASAKAKFKTDDPVLPMDVVAAEVDRRWPGKWAGPFVEGARGVRFWDPKADNPTGCTLRSTGVQAWTGEGKFIRWTELLGQDFAKNYRQNRITGAVDGSYYDGQLYWQRDGEAIWQAFSGAQMERRLATNHALSCEAKKGQRSETSHAMSFIEDNRRVDGAFPCLFMPQEVVRDGTKKYLNISRAKVHPAGGQARAWGEGFPFIASYVGGLFDEKQREVFLSWLAHFYVSASAGAPRKGHALFVAGPPSAGKTLLSQKLIGGLMGGFAEATNYISGHTNFNEGLFHEPIWAVDDGELAADRKRHSGYSALVKKIVANPYQEYHPKFRKAVTFKFNGRLIVTLNIDASSINMLPDLDGSIRDKLVILKAGDPGVSFRDAEQKIAGELAAFADFIRDWRTPDWLCTRDSETIRFGHDSWCHPELAEIASDASQSAMLRELLETWREMYFRSVTSEVWFGTPLDLLLEIEATEPLKSQLPRVPDRSLYIRRNLTHMVEQGVAWVQKHRDKTKRGFLIIRPDHIPIKK